jgi:hypothetical protein
VVAVDILRADIDREELSAEEALHPWQIGLAALIGCSDVIPIDGLRGNIVVRVDQYGVTRDASYFGIRDRFGAGLLGGNRKHSRSKHSKGNERAKSNQEASFRKQGFPE